MNKVAVYITSRKNSNDRSKENRVINYCYEKKYDFDVYMDYIESKQELFNRVNLNKLKKEIKNKKYNKVIIYGLDNVSRNNLYNATFIEFIYKNNCEIKCVDGTIIDKEKIVMEYRKKIINKKKKGKYSMQNEIENSEVAEREQRNSINKFELEGNVGFIGDKFTNKNGKESLKFELGQNNNGNTQFVPIILRGELVNTYGSVIKKGDWLSIKGRISSYSKEVERDGKTFKEKVIDMLGFEITDKNNNKVYSSNGKINEIEKNEEKER